MLLIYGIICYIVKVNKWVLHLLFSHDFEWLKNAYAYKARQKEMFHNGIVKLEYHMQ